MLRASQESEEGVQNNEILFEICVYFGSFVLLCAFFVCMRKNTVGQKSLRQLTPTRVLAFGSFFSYHTAEFLCNIRSIFPEMCAS